MIAPPIEPLAPATARSGIPDGNSETSRLVYRDVATLPMTATPSVPPKRRVASLTADPTPAFAAGTAPMIASVAGALVRPIPEPRNSI